MLVEIGSSVESCKLSAKTSQSQAAVNKLLSQRRLASNCGIQVRLSAQNQVFLNTKRPTRVAIPAWLLERLVPGCVAGKRAFLRASYGNAVAYHVYNGGESWVPTVPKSVGKPDDVLEMNVESLNSANFVSSFPRLGLGTRQRVAWMTEQSGIDVSMIGVGLSLDVKQYPSIEGIADYSLRGRLVGDLVFQTGSIYAVVEITDAFSVPRFLQLHHNGHRRAWISFSRHKSAKIKLLSFDGFRLRIRYRLGRRSYGTVVYLKDPSQLYSLGEREAVPEGIELPWADRAFLIRDVRPLRELEQMMVQHADFYETGRIGAEITYSVLTQRLGIRGLILNEPGKGGPDLQTEDNRFIVESRFLVEVDSNNLKTQILRDLAQMTRRIRHEFRRNSRIDAGYVVISFLDCGRIDSLVAELVAPK